MSDHAHEASQSALGYIYQSQWPLLELLRRAPSRPDAALTLELHDDVVWQQGGTPTELLQVKHHINAHRGLGDMDADLWKTVGVWMENGPPGDADGPLLTLVTTATAAAGTAAAALRSDAGRDASRELTARELLDAAARASDNAATAAVRGRYLALSEPDRDVFVSRITVLDAQPQAAANLEDSIREELHWALATVAGHETTFMDQLWGWWHRVALSLLRRERASVSAIDVQMKISELADGYRPDNLPVLVARDDVTFDVTETYDDRLFVQQLRWVAHTALMLQQAMVDYYRAYAQRAKWVDLHLIGVGELETFEDNLVDEWQRAFQAIVARLGPEATDDAKRLAGADLFQAVSNQTVVKVRDRFNDPFFMRGRLHDFADKGSLGWHPDFEARVKEVLGL